jgi:integral membrane protein 2B
MTIYKPNNPDRKQEKKLVNGPEIVIDDQLVLAKSADGAEVLFGAHRRPITNTEVLRRRRALRCIFAFCAVAFVVVLALAAVLFVHRYIINRPFMGNCIVPFRDDSPPIDYELRGPPPASAPQQGLPPPAPRTGSFEESVEVDANGAYERLVVPPVLDFRRSTVVHDFEKNLTAIVDLDHGRCFILPLNRDTVKPPKSFIDLLEKFKSGYYLPNAQVVRERYKVVTPALLDLAPLGPYINADCQFFDTYRLIKDDQPIVKSKKKRSADLGCMMQGDGFCLGSTFDTAMFCISIDGCDSSPI